MADPIHLQQQQEIDATISGVVDAQGRPTTFDGAPVWESSDEGIVDIRASEDGLSAILGSLDTKGNATITVTGDARHGADVIPVMAVLSVIVLAGDVTMFDFEVGEARTRT